MNKQNKNIAKNIEQMIIPALNRIRRRSSPSEQKQIDLLKNNLHKLTSDFGHKISINEWGLSAREIEVCKLIKKGASTLEIADILCTSKRTIDNHRNNIRKKLGINSIQISLSEYLNSLE